MKYPNPLFGLIFVLFMAASSVAMSLDNPVPVSV
jgi:hypothetical protein